MSQAVARPVVRWRLGARGRIRSKQPTAGRNGNDRRRHGHAAATHAKS
jgi:hypothetical protein